MAVNCGAIPEHLLEAEFFGARKGAYTGATADREGFFSAARGGTLFWTRLASCRWPCKANCCALSKSAACRPGHHARRSRVDVRIVSATHRDLAADVHSGHFRQDLYYRLNVIDIPIPPLRERREDVPALCTALLQRIAGEGMGNLVPTLSDHVLAHLQQQPLHGQRPRAGKPAAPRHCFG